MKKLILNLGKGLSKAEQKKFNGGGPPPPPPGLTPPPCNEHGGTVIAGKTEQNCQPPGIWYENECWVCYE